MPSTICGVDLVATITLVITLTVGTVLLLEGFTG